MQIVKISMFMLLVLAAGCARPITLLSVPTDVNMLLSPAPTSASALEQMQMSAPKVPWNIYHSGTYGFTFAYPAAYDEPQYQTCSPRAVEQPDGTQFSIGHQSFLNVQQKDDLNLQVYAGELAARKQVEGTWNLESQNTRLAGGEEAIEVNYRFGGTGRFGTATFLKHKRLLLTFNFSAGAFCDVPEINLHEGQAYAQWIDSLKFDE